MTAPSGKTFVFPASLNDSPLFNRENLRFSILSVPVIIPYLVKRKCAVII